MQDLSDSEIEKRYLDACVNSIQWLIDQIEVRAGELTMEGWAIAVHGEPSKARFLINGETFDHIEYPIHSPGLKNHFWNIDAAEHALFRCRTSSLAGKIFDDGFARLEFQDEGASPDAIRRKAWYFPDSYPSLSIPEDLRIRRVIGTPDTTSYLVGGASIARRFEDFLEQQYDQSFSDFSSVLDWGCGSGRVSRHLHQQEGIELWGADVDGDNIKWCKQNLPRGNFVQVPLLPPTSLPSNYFDLIVGISVLTHLNEENQFAWLEELKRISKPGSILILSVQGLPQMGLYQPTADVIRRVEEEGFVVTGRNDALDEVIDNQSYYINVIQSRGYLREKWGRYFTVLDIVDALAANQDAVILKNDG